MMANQNISNSRGVRNVIPTASHLLSSTLKLVSDAIQSWIGKPISKRRKGEKAKRLLEEDLTQMRTIPVSLHRSGETRRRVLPAFDVSSLARNDGGDENLKKTYLLNCDTCDRSYHSQCLQPPATADITSAWRCSFCLNHPETTVSAIMVEPPEELEDKSFEIQSSISNVSKRKNPNTVKHEDTNEKDNGVKLNSKQEEKEQNIGLGYWTVRTDLMPNENVPNNSISNSSRKLKNTNTVEDENTYEQDNSNELNTRHVDKKRKVESGYLTVRTDLMRNENVVNSYGETSFIQTDADLVSNAIRLDRPNTKPPLIETPFLRHSSGRVARSIKAEPNEIDSAPFSLLTRKVKSGWLTMRTNLMLNENVVNSHGETSFIQTDTDVVSNAIRLDRPDSTPPLIETPFLRHTSGRVARSIKAEPNEIDSAPFSLLTRKVKSGCLTVCMDLMPNENVPNNSISNSSRKLKNTNTVEDENTYEQDNSNELNTRHVDKKRKVESGYLTVRTDLMRNENVVNSYGETSFIQTDADLVSNAIRLDRPNTKPPLIETPFLRHSSGRVARSIKAEPNEIDSAPFSLLTRKVKSGWLTMRTNLMLNENVVNSHGETSFIQTDTDVVSNAIRLDRPDSTPPLIETPFLRHTSGRVARSIKAEPNEIDSAPFSLLTRKVKSGCLTVCMDLMPNENVANNSISNSSRKLKNTNTVEDENTYEQDNSNELNTRHVDKKLKVESGYLTVRTDLMRNENVVNSYGETSFIQTDADLVSNAIRLDRPNTKPPLIETPFLRHSSGRVARSIKAEPNEIDSAPFSLLTRKVKSGWLTMRTNLMLNENVVNSHGETSFIQTDTDVVSNAIRLDRPDSTPPLIETPFLRHTSGRVARSIKAEPNEIDSAPFSLLTRKVKSGCLTVCMDLMPNENVANNYTSNSSRKLKNPNTVENENTYEEDNSNELNTRHLDKKRKVESGYLTVRTDLMRNENVLNNYGETSFILTEADLVSNAIRLDRPNATPPLIETPFSGHGSARVARSVKANKSNLKMLKYNRVRSPEIKCSMFGTPSSSMSRCDDPKDVLENMSRPFVSGVVHDDVEICKKTRTRSTIQAPERCPAAIQFGEFEVEAWYSSTFPGEAPKLYFCEFCLKFTKSKSVLKRHSRCCNRRRPPGIEIYQSGDLSVFEVDGYANKTYCQTLCKLGKLFVDSKTMYYGVQQFLFYILTKNDGFGSHVVGYFSKEKYNEENLNVACVLTMPQYQRQGYGRFLIEFSYLLSITEKQPGTPEKPLSGLGQLSYDSYWKSVIIEYLDSHRNSEIICINDISSKTGLMRRDITNTIQSLNMVVEIFNELTICIDWSIVDAHMKSEKKSKKILIEPDCLDWTPASISSNSLFSPDGEDSQNIEKPLLIKCLA